MTTDIYKTFLFCDSCLCGWSIIGDKKCWSCGEEINISESFYNGDGGKFVCPAMRKHIGG